MGARKVADLSVIVGDYQKDGQTKKKYQNVGAMMKNEDGGFFLLLNRFFSPAGVPGSEGRESIIINVYKKDQQGSGGGQGGQQGQPGGGYAPVPPAGPPQGEQGGYGGQGVPGGGAPSQGPPQQSFEDDIPF